MFTALCQFRRKVPSSRPLKIKFLSFQSRPMRCSMKHAIALTTALSAFALLGIANAQTTSGGTMGVTADIEGSINLLFSTATGGFAVTGTGSATASLPFGNVQMYGGTVPTNVTRTLTGKTAFTLSTPINVEVDLANQASDNYSLLGTLASADAVNTWTFNAIAVTSAGATPQVTAGTYGSAAPYVFAVTIPASNTSGTLTNSINFTATAN
jgi:hypothetical protein